MTQLLFSVELDIRKKGAQYMEVERTIAVTDLDGVSFEDFS